MHPLAHDREDTKDEEACQEVGQGVAEEVKRGLIIRLTDEPVEEFLNSHGNRHADDHPDDALPPICVDPLQGREVQHGVRPPKDHSDEDEDDRCLFEGLIQSQVVVRSLDKPLRARVVLIARVHNPVLRHGPRTERRRVQDDGEDEEADEEEEEVEFSGATAPHAEACAQ